MWRKPFSYQPRMRKFALALDRLHKPPAERAVHRAARVIVVAEQERQIDEAQFRHAVGEIARRLIAEREHAALDQPQDFLGLVAEIHDVPAILDVDAVAELLFQPVADEFHRLAEAGGRRAVAAHADGNWIGHGYSSPDLCVTPGLDLGGRLISMFWRSLPARSISFAVRDIGPELVELLRLEEVAPRRHLVFAAAHRIEEARPLAGGNFLRSKALSAPACAGHGMASSSPRTAPRPSLICSGVGQAIAAA